MGRIAIETSGSFEIRGTRYIGAISRGHASAVAEAISYLSGHILPSAIKQDHELHEQGQKPEIEFGGQNLGSGNKINKR
ncbi:hypothetical protein LCGC14_1422880 [marine sediment metagenome]|uniref:Uncharacterized protein n=1 Tax=marine sediment metagenome TaxID=412755 RepID=A0A0F9KBW5_9ZZZZ